MTGSLDWNEICALASNAIGGEVDTPCPVCGPDRRSRANQLRRVLRIWRPDPDSAGYYCARCGLSGYAQSGDKRSVRRDGAIRRALSKSHPLPAPANPSAAEIERIAFAEFLFFSADPIAGSLADTYLSTRGLGGLDAADLRFSPATPTFLRPDGSKIERLSFGSVIRGAVRLAPHSSELAVAEGAETAASFTRLYGVPAWAALSANGLIRFEPPPGLRRLYIAADNDLSERGLEAAKLLAERASHSCEVAISVPAKPGDWNDVLRLGAGRVAA